MIKVLRLLVLLAATQASAQYKYGVEPVTLDAYKASLKIHPENELVDLETVIPGIALDIRYATTNNFTKAKVYNQAKAFVRRPVAIALKRIQAELKKEGLALKIYDAYRPYAATVKFYELVGDTNFVASPYRGSIHNRGCALDLTIINIKTQEEIKMPTAYDSFTKEASPRFPVKDPEVGRNRARLIGIMAKHGFKVNASEWWHYDFSRWKQFDVMDISFEELMKEKPTRK